MPSCWAAFMACSAARRAAKGVLLRDPLKPAEPAEPQATVFPSVSVTVTIVLLKEAKICTCPLDSVRFPFFAPVARRVERTLWAIIPYTFRTTLLLRATAATTTGYRLLGALAGARIGLRALAAYRQVATMSQTAIGADLDQALDVQLNLAAQVAFDLVILGDVFANRGDLRFA